MISPVRWMLAACVTLVWVPLASAQSQPVPGVTGTVATEGTVEQEYKGANAVIVKTKDGVEHVFNAAKGLVVHGNKGAGEPLADLREGQQVVIHYTTGGAGDTAQEIDRVGADGLQTTEGTVIDINRARKQITVRFENRTTETFRLTDRAAADAGKGIDASGDTKVIIYYTDESGRKVAHYFRKAS